ncbi:cytochrome b/b6 domain-containing protein [Phaeobacter gallaeciensis]|uniref:cytochrome b/b6 domain-containing protein n=1 Tax=Phaeobacter gallaeciensis TaxID=60890 RepID=UPI00237EEBDD|nr:cytochrome b/b6 domain-containing protein [Phaeobacter gallaeciensis]MDE4063648.1 cytochrome b/b6 domain-containing protein [Phaeobacter gallaeciensis]MDE4126658.1 cytochrome b/b6 domain-containing protein [Phaeobacter gallaeciensis]MDE4131144.1 cytochrome b/b6 domain-containing protein [Phaeobacter gallaeciensis]
MSSHFETQAGRDQRPSTIKVWDPLVRIFHWSLVAGMAYEMLAEAGTDVHEFVGYGLLALVAVRIIWGFIGTKHALFSDFVTNPIDTVAYLKDIVVGHPKRYLGHNPAGAAMVLLLLIAVSGTAGTGWAMTTDALWGEEWIEELHEICAYGTIVLVAGHVIGVIVASVQHRENLLRAMITGRKPT